LLSKKYKTRNAWQSPAVARQAHRTATHPAKTPLASNKIDAPAACATLSATRLFHFVRTVGVLWVHSAFLSLVTLTFDFWPWRSNSCKRRTKYVFDVNLAQISSAVPAIHCRIRVPRLERVWPISPIWRISGCQTITINSGVSGSKFIKFLHDADRTSALLIRPSAFPYCRPLWDEGRRVADFGRFRT